MKKCISCGGDCGNSPIEVFNTFVICQTCEDVGNQMASLFEAGAVLEYSDGFKEVVKLETDGGVR